MQRRWPVGRTGPRGRARAVAASLALHAALALAWLSVGRPAGEPVGVTTRAEIARAVELVPPPPPLEPEFELPRREELVAEPLLPEWEPEAPDFAPEPRADAPVTIHCADPFAATARFAPPRRRSAAPEAAGTGDAVDVAAPRPPLAASPAAHASAPVLAATPAAFVALREPRYPRTALDLGIEGVVVLRVVIAADGSLEAVEVVRSSGSALLDRAAIAAVETWEFRPATVRGEPVHSTLRLPPIKFRLTD